LAQAQGHFCSNVLGPVCAPGPLAGFVMVLAAVSSPVTPPLHSHLDAGGIEGVSPSKRRRARQMATKGRLWHRTRWGRLAGDVHVEKQENPLDAMEERVEVKFEELAGGFAAGLGDILKSAIASMGLLKAADLQCIRDEIRKEVQIDAARLDSRMDSVAGSANLQKEGLRKKIGVLYGRVAVMETRIRDIEHLVIAEDTVTEAEEEDVEEVLVQGSVVRIFGLTARLELNGEVGMAVQFDAKKGRWQMRLARGDLLLQAMNLMPFDIQAK